MIGTTTDREAYFLVKSILYRERICQELPELKGSLYRYVEDHGGVVYLNGYEVRASRGQLDFKKLEAPDWEQLRLALGDASSTCKY